MPSRAQQMVQTYLSNCGTRKTMADQMSRINSTIKDLEEGIGDGMIKNGFRTINLGQHGVIQVTLLTKYKKRKKSEVEMALMEMLGDKANVDRIMSIVYAPVQTNMRKLDHLPPQPSFANVDIGKVNW